MGTMLDRVQGSHKPARTFSALGKRPSGKARYDLDTMLLEHAKARFMFLERNDPPG